MGQLSREQLHELEQAFLKDPKNWKNKMNLEQMNRLKLDSEKRRLNRDVPAIDFGTPYIAEDRWKLDTFSKESIALLGRGAGRHRHVNTVRTLSNELNLNMKPNMEDPQFRMDSVAGQKGQEWYLHNLKMRKKLKKIKRQMRKNYVEKTKETGLAALVNNLYNKYTQSDAEKLVEELKRFDESKTIAGYGPDLLRTYISGGSSGNLLVNPDLVFGEASLNPLPYIPLDTDKLSLEK